MSSARDIEEVCRDGGRAVAGLGQASPPASVSQLFIRWSEHYFWIKWSEHYYYCSDIQLLDQKVRKSLQ